MQLFKRGAVQRRPPKHPHKPASQRLGARTTLTSVPARYQCNRQALAVKLALERAYPGTQADVKMGHFPGCGHIPKRVTPVPPPTFRPDLDPDVVGVDQAGPARFTRTWPA